MKITLPGYRTFTLSPRFVLRCMAAGVITGCCSRPSPPSPAEVDLACHEVAVLTSQAKLNAPWSGLQLRELDAESAAIQSNMRRFAR